MSRWAELVQGVLIGLGIGVALGGLSLVVLGAYWGWFVVGVVLGAVLAAPTWWWRYSAGGAPLGRGPPR